MAFPDRTVLEFRFRTIELNRLDWREFVRRPNPVAAALMAKMQIAPADRPRVKLECLRLLATLRLDPAKTQLILSFVDSYLRLNTREQQSFNQQLAAISPPEQEQTMQLMTSWKEEGRQKGMGATVLRQLRRRFGPLSEPLEARISALPTEQLEDLVEALLDFTVPADLDAWLTHAGD